MQLPPYIDPDLVHLPGDLPFVLEEFGDRLAWHRAGTCTIKGSERDLCLAFSLDTGLAVRLGVRSLDCLSIDPLPLRADQRIRFVRREHPRRYPSKPGVSLLILWQVMLNMEGELQRNFFELQSQGEPTKSAFMRMIPEIYGTLTLPDGTPTLPDGVSPSQALFLAAAKLTVRAFYDSRLFGGRDSLWELTGAFNHLCLYLRDELADMEVVAQDLRFLNSLSDGQMEEYADMQRHVADHVLAMLRYVSVMYTPPRRALTA